ncbi:ATP-grasp domain-containing protein [Curtobacterium ammoniigenes]|uniref:ATP-grasp domain-containing protein n=1 Tax=Curtobacterium ammoniigenes TaxID=395387 RepID=UPI0008352551|nr:alpha-L-glutamate ligase [Curtobacterium ammoniigenes]
MTEPRVHVIHENPEWFPPLAAAFAEEGVPVAEILLTDGAIDLDAEPEPGVYWSRLSASSHTRDHADAKEYGRALLGWLERAGRTVVNGSSVLEIEVSKVRQHGLLRAAGFDVPRTVAAFGRADLIAAAERFVAATPGAPFITKHNQGGKGLGVRRFDAVAELREYVQSPAFEAPVDGITLIQEHLRSAEPFITRVEFVDAAFVYAVRVDTSGGSFELCPADACAVPDATAREQGGAFAPAACDVPLAGPAASPFTLRDDIQASTPIVQRLERFLADAGIQIAGIEFMETDDGRTVVYDINTNTNYNPDVESVSPVSGPRTIAAYLGRVLATATPDSSPRQTADR